MQINYITFYHSTLCLDLGFATLTIAICWLSHEYILILTSHTGHRYESGKLKPLAFGMSCLVIIKTQKLNQATK